ncbi:MAG: class I SAM-dependent methyltransferase [Actinobacteria bacterium]|nr:class I SAM-dependent methyltransferase [Actinomycetota bacterium]MDQ3533193.1 class I SAM-dependent methyltransferase [Actinomycetota bacterium]
MSRSSPPTSDFSKVKQQQKDAWESGDLGMFSKTIVLVSELLCEAVDLRSNQKVLDVAAGTGNTAIAAARRWCDVTAVDFVQGLLEQARRRAEVEAFSISVAQGDAENLPFKDSSFDVVLSTFGSMFAPNQERTAVELLRVCRPGGKVGMTNFPPDSFAGEFFRAMARHAPPPRGIKPSVLWGLEDRLHDLFGAGASSIDLRRRTFFFRYASPQHWLDVFRTYFGPVRSAFQTLDTARAERLSTQLLNVVGHFNQATDGTVVAPCDYVEIVVLKRT